MGLGPAKAMRLRVQPGAENVREQAHHHHQQAHQEVHQQAHHPPDMDRHSGFFHRQHSAPGLAMMQGGGGGGGPEAHHEGGWEQGMQAPDMGHLHLSEMPGTRSPLSAYARGGTDAGHGCEPCREW